MNIFIRKNLTLLITLSVLTGLFVAAANGMESGDFVITLLRGLSVGSLTFLVASGFSLIFGLLDVLNLAHGTLFMIGAYIGWTVYVRPDTVVDLLSPITLILSGFLLKDVWMALSTRDLFSGRLKRILPWIGIVLSVMILFVVLRSYPIAIWDVGNYALSPVSISYLASQGLNTLPAPATFEKISPLLAFAGLLVGGLLLAFSLSLFGAGKQVAAPRINWRSFVGFVVLLLIGILVFFFNNALTDFLVGVNTNWLFLIAVRRSARGSGLHL